MRRVRTLVVLAGLTGLVVALVLLWPLVAQDRASTAAPQAPAASSPAPTTSPAPSVSSPVPAAISPTPAASSPTPSASSRPYEILGLGDSVVSGTACSCADYVTGLGQLLKAVSGHRVLVDNEGQDGLTSSDLLDDLEDRRLRTEVGRSDLVVITVGANDLSPLLDRWRTAGCAASCRRDAVAAMGARIGRVVDAVRQDGAGRVAVTTYWNVFVDGAVGEQAEGQGYLSWSDTLTREANSAICRATTAADGVCVDLYAPFKGNGEQDPTRLLADDGDHPNAAGTALISRTLLAVATGPAQTPVPAQASTPR